MVMRTIRSALPAGFAGGVGLVTLLALGGVGTGTAESDRASAPLAGATCRIRPSGQADNGEVKAVNLTKDVRSTIPEIDTEVPARTEIALFGLG